MPSAWITGGAMGLGADMARGLLAAGYSVTLLDVDGGALDRTASSLRASSPGALRIDTRVLDVCEAAAQHAAVAAHVAAHGGLDVAVLNAGISERGPVWDTSNAGWQRTLDVDLTAVIEGARAAAGVMRTGGTIIAVASAGGVFPMPAAPVYAASKAGVVHFVRSAGRPLAKQRGIRLLAVCPEFVDTALFREVLNADPQQVRRVLGQVDLKPLQPSAVTDLILAILTQPHKHPGGSVALLRQDGRVEVPSFHSPTAPAFARTPPAPSRSPASPGASPTAVPLARRDALTRWARSPPVAAQQPGAHGAVPTGFRKLQVFILGTDFRAVTRLVGVEPGLATAVVTGNGAGLPAGTLAVRNVFAGVNASDINYTAGRYHASKAEATKQLPYDCGFECVGVVAAVGPEVTGWAPGDVVAALSYGAFADVSILPVRAALRVEAGGQVDPRAVALLTSGLTASIALAECGRLKAGEKVLVTAAAGGTGVFAVQLAKRAGCRVLATAGGPDKAALLRQLGADRVIDYKRDDVKAILKEEGGVDVVYESVGGALFDTCVNALAPGGRLIIIGMMSQYAEGWPASAHPGLAEKLLWKSASMHGFFLLRHAKLWRSHWDALNQLLAAGQLTVPLDSRRYVGVPAVPDAVDRLQSGHSMGKVVVQIPDNLPPSVDSRL